MPVTEAKSGKWKLPQQLEGPRGSCVALVQEWKEPLHPQTGKRAGD